MGNPLPLIIDLVSGALGGNAAASLLKKLSLGMIGNSIVGILGGGLGGQLLKMLGIATSSGEAPTSAASSETSRPEASGAGS